MGWICSLSRSLWASLTRWYNPPFESYDHYYEFNNSTDYYLHNCTTARRRPRRFS